MEFFNLLLESSMLSLFFMIYFEKDQDVTCLSSGAADMYYILTRKVMRQIEEQYSKIRKISGYPLKVSLDGHDRGTWAHGAVRQARHPVVLGLRS